MRRRSTPRLLASEAMLAYLVAVPLLIIAAPPLYRRLGLFAMVLVQFTFIAGPAIAVATLHGRRLGHIPALLGLRRPRVSAALGAALIGVSFWYLNLLVVAPIGERFLGGNKLARTMDQTIFGGGQPLWVIVLLVALAPAICEELLLRGAAARAFEKPLGRPVAVLVSAILFGAMHLHPAQMITTFAFALLLGYATVVTDSVMPAMLMHMLNNATALVIGSGAIPTLTVSLRSRVELWAPIAAALSICGCALLWWSWVQSRSTQPATNACITPS